LGRNEKSQLVRIADKKNFVKKNFKERKKSQEIFWFFLEAVIERKIEGPVQ
jgi:hypothetical protein